MAGAGFIAVVLTSIASALVNLPIVHRQARPASRELMVSSLLQILVGATVVFFQAKVF
jgi:hypothetical protein